MKRLSPFNKPSDESGFSLVELLIVILIIGILASIAIPVFLNQRQAANDTAVEADVRNTASVLETYFSDKHHTSTGDMNYIKANGSKSEGVILRIQGKANDYCIWATHTNAGKYPGGAWISPNPRPYYLYSSKEGGFVKTGGVTSLSCSQHGDSPLVWS